MAPRVCAGWSTFVVTCITPFTCWLPWRIRRILRVFCFLLLCPESPVFSAFTNVTSPTPPPELREGISVLPGRAGGWQHPGRPPVRLTPFAPAPLAEEPANREAPTQRAAPSALTCRGCLPHCPPPASSATAPTGRVDGERHSGPRELVRKGAQDNDSGSDGPQVLPGHGVHGHGQRQQGGAASFPTKGGSPPKPTGLSKHVQKPKGVLAAAEVSGA